MKIVGMCQSTGLCRVPARSAGESGRTVGAHRARTPGVGSAVPIPRLGADRRCAGRRPACLLLPAPLLPTLVQRDGRRAHAAILPDRGRWGPALSRRHALSPAGSVLAACTGVSDRRALDPGRALGGHDPVRAVLRPGLAPGASPSYARRGARTGGVAPALSRLGLPALAVLQLLDDRAPRSTRHAARAAALLPLRQSSSTRARGFSVRSRRPLQAGLRGGLSARGLFLVARVRHPRTGFPGEPLCLVSGTGRRGGILGGTLLPSARRVAGRAPAHGLEPLRGDVDLSVRNLPKILAALHARPHAA